ncbi:MAG: rfbC [Frankiales bacterium]|jgi:dTDP-4-dehydrorhamnose 3,5-epimerase|nr:rfbC [Frankiales bacterium]
MRLAPTGLSGVVLVHVDPAADERGSFSRVWDQDEFAAAGLPERLDLHCVSSNRAQGTLRGMHWQEPPYGEIKLVRCSRGAVFDVAVDVRRDSPSYLQWFGIELRPETGECLYLPAGVAHGFLTLSDDTEVSYLMTSRYSPEHARGLRYDDPAVAITWPAPPQVISDRDRDFALLEP